MAGNKRSLQITSAWFFRLRKCGFQKMEKRKMRQWDPRQIKMKLTDEYINKKESRRNKEKVF